MHAHLHDGQGQAALRPTAANQDLFAAHCTEPVVLRVHCAADLPEVLSRAEDLFQRIQNHPGLRLWVVKDAAMDTSFVLVRSLNAVDSQGCHMLETLQDRDLYRWMLLQDDNLAMGRSHSLLALRVKMHSGGCKGS